MENIKLYHVASALESKQFIDFETGEIDETALDELKMSFDEKVRNLACFIINLTATSNAIKEQEKNLKARREKKDKQIERLKRYISKCLQMANVSTREYAEVAVSLRKSTAIELEDGFVEWAKEHGRDFLRYPEPTADKTAIKKALDSGIPCDMAHEVERQNLQIK